MTPFKTLLQEPYLEIIRALDGQAFFVGGCVRDVLLSRQVGDVDMATSFEPTVVMKKLSANGFKVVPTGLKHGTVTVVLPAGKSVEITTFRKDVQTDGRHAKVAFLPSMEQDALRRDLTVNALYVDAKGKLYDFCGGLRDLKKGRVRFIGRADQRIHEDALRLMRFFRFWGLFDGRSPDKEAIKACRRCRPLLKKLSKERRRDELFKILSGPRVMDVLHQMEKTGVLKVLLPVRSGALFCLRKLVTREKSFGVPFDPLLHLWVLTRGFSDLKLSNAQKAFLKKLSAADEYPLKTQKDALTILYLFGEDVFRAMILLKKKRLPFTAWLFYSRLPRPVFPITARDVQQKDGVSSEALGQKLREYETRWMNLNFPKEKKVVFSFEKE